MTERIKLDLSLNKPAWTSLSKGIKTAENIKDHDSDGFVCLVVKNAIYYRVKVVNETSTYITIRYTIYKGGVSKFITEIINKSDVIDVRDYVD